MAAGWFSGWARAAAVVVSVAACEVTPPQSPSDDATSFPEPSDSDTGEDTVPPTDTGPPGPTGDSGDHITTVGPDWASCSLSTDNALRVVCTVSDLSREGTATFTIDQGTIQRTAVAEVGEEVVLWGFAPNRQLTWTVEQGGDVGTGAFPTQPLPPGVASIQSTVTGSPLEVEAFAVPYTCDGQAGAAVFEAATGDVLWYHQEASQGLGVLAGNVGFDWVDDHALMALFGRDLLEIEANGTRSYRIAGTDRPVHHDVAIGPEHRYALNASQHGVTVVDGFYVFDASGVIVAEWDLADHVEVGTTGIGAFWLLEFPFAADWSHANSIEIDGPDHVLLSLKHLNAALRVVSNPVRPDFGTIEWVLDGGRSELASDFDWADAGGFRDQHHVSRQASGDLLLFDNGSQEFSRALAVSLDAKSGTAVESGSWSVERRCAIQGSAYEQPGGHLLVMCPTDGTVREFAPDEAAATLTVELLCLQRTEGSGHFARAIPVPLPE